MITNVIGFTGSQLLAEKQQPVISRVLDTLPHDSLLVVGACIGVDAYIAYYTHTVRGLKVHAIVPANRSKVDPLWQTFCSSWYTMPPGTNYRDRNVEIVKASDKLIAFPRFPEQHSASTRSGTWMTVRIARRAGKSVEVHLL